MASSKSLFLESMFLIEGNDSFLLTLLKSISSSSMGLFFGFGGFFLSLKSFSFGVFSRPQGLDPKSLRA